MKFQLFKLSTNPKPWPRKLLGYLLTSGLIVLCGLIIPGGKIGAVCLALGSVYGTFAASHAFTDAKCTPKTEVVVKDET